jgi:hypothetical protein
MVIFKISCFDLLINLWSGLLMDEARCVESGELVFSEELYIIDDVPSLSFCCDECGIDLIPCSYVKDVNLRKPYFKLNKGEEHIAGCYAEGDAKVKGSGLTSRLSTSKVFLWLIQITSNYELMMLLKGQSKLMAASECVNQMAALN